MNFSMIVTALFTAFNSFATVDGITDVAIVVNGDSEGLTFEMRTVPMMSCAGIHEMSIDGLWTKPVNVSASIGCGGPVINQNINAGSCVISTLGWDKHISVLHEVRLMTAYCSSYWEQSWMSVHERAAVKASFENALKKAAKFNFGSTVPIVTVP